jgi:hypothetical protein
MRIITYNDKVALWSRSNHLIGTRMLPSRNNNFSETPQRTRTEIMINQATLFLELFNYAYFSPPP